MARLNAGQIAFLAELALGETTLDNDKVITATAIALAESGGETTETNTNTDGSIDTGLWQINSVHRRDHPSWSVSWLKDENNNARAMATVSNGGTNWRPWVAYRTGRYREHLDQVRAAVNAERTEGGGVSLPGLPGSPGTGLPGAIESPLEALIEVVDILKDVGKWIGNPSNWIRIIQVTGGIVLAIVAAGIIGNTTTAGRIVKKAASKGLA